MKIGEFAAACSLPISMLRYYDSCGLLKPVYVDRFTGYRYYSETQIAVCERIGELKEAGFSLAEIKSIISGKLTEKEIRVIFNERKNQLNEVIRSLDTLSEKILGGIFMTAEKIEPLRENISLPFKNDEKVVGRWAILGEYNDRTEFELDNRLPRSDIGNKNREIYFLPNGESYWCYSWTNGKLLINDGESSSVNEYSVERQTNGLYMFVDLKSYDYLHSGRTTLLVLRQLDRKRYKADELARKDNIEMPFSQTIKMLSGSGKLLILSKAKTIFHLKRKRQSVVSILKKLNFSRAVNASVFTETRSSAAEICRSGQRDMCFANGTKQPALMK